MRANSDHSVLARLAPVAWVVVLLAGCASAANDMSTSSMTCRDLALETAGTRQARTQALEKQQDPFKFVIPFAVAGHHVASHSAVSDADRRLAELDEQSHKLGCTRQS